MIPSARVIVSGWLILEGGQPVPYGGWFIIHVVALPLSPSTPPLLALTRSFHAELENHCASYLLGSLNQSFSAPTDSIDPCCQVHHYRCASPVQLQFRTTNLIAYEYTTFVVAVAHQKRLLLRFAQQLDFGILRIGRRRQISHVDLSRWCSFQAPWKGEGCLQIAYEW